jgi:dTDP-4-dehydrorhamnose 3,5-epimerase
MVVKELPLDGLKLITLTSFQDERGFFCQRYMQNSFAEIGITELVQDNFSRSAPKVLRGLHYQWDLPQGKLVTVTHGSIYDVTVDIRKSSPTYGKSFGIELRSAEPQWLWIPAGFAHGFCVLGNQDADVIYKINNYWNPKGEAGLMWNDPALEIQWPYSDPLLSPKDKNNPSFEDYQSAPKF